MSKNIKLLISEVTRINDLMSFTENREIINESMSTIIRSLRILVKNSADEIAQYGSKELDNLINLMKKSKSADDFFSSLESMKSFNDDVAKQLRRDIFDILPEATQTRIKNIVKQLEDNQDKLSDKDTLDIINNIIETQFKNEPESVKAFLKDSVLDNSDVLTIKVENGNLSKIIDDLAGITDDMTPPSPPDNQESKKWYDKLNFKRDEYKEFIKNAKKNGSPAKYWDRKTFNEKMAEVSKIGRTADKDAVRWIEKAAENNPGWWAKKPWWGKALTIAGTIGVGPEIVEVIFWLFTKRISGFSIFGLTSKLDDLANQASGGLSKLDSSNESEIKLAIANISDKYTKLGAFDDSKYTLDYSGDGQSVSVVSLTPPYDTLDTYDRNEINESLNTL